MVGQTFERGRCVVCPRADSEQVPGGIDAVARSGSGCPLRYRSLAHTGVELSTASTPMLRAAAALTIRSTFAQL